MASVWDKMKYGAANAFIDKAYKARNMNAGDVLKTGGRALASTLYGPTWTKAAEYSLPYLQKTYGAYKSLAQKGVGELKQRFTPAPQPETPQAENLAYDPLAGLGDVLGAADGGGGYGGGGYGGGGGAVASGVSAYDQLMAQQRGLADTERANINARRDAAIQQIEKEYADQMAYLDTQVSGLQGSAATGKESVAKQKAGTIATAQQQAETAAMAQRDVYKDLLLQGRRRARATGAGSSSGYQEITGMLDNQLARNLGQVEQTKQNQVGVANNVADQAVSQIEASLQSALGEIANNRATSMREKDRMANEVRMNAADALLEVDKWVTQAFSDIETAKINLRTGGGGGYSRGGGYSKTQATQQQRAAQAQILGNLQNYLEQAAEMGQLKEGDAQARWRQTANALTQIGTSPGDIANYARIYGYQLGAEEEPWWMK